MDIGLSAHLWICILKAVRMHLFENIFLFEEIIGCGIESCLRTRRWKASWQACFILMPEWTINIPAVISVETFPQIRLILGSCRGQDPSLATIGWKMNYSADSPARNLLAQAEKKKKKKNFLSFFLSFFLSLSLSLASFFFFLLPPWPNSPSKFRFLLNLNYSFSAWLFYFFFY